MITLETRFWAKVDRRGAEDCWPWIAHVDKHGYGRINSGGANGRAILAHRVAYELLVGAIPEGMSLDHLCRNRSCVNPRHLEPLSWEENRDRGLASKTKTHCVNGHEFTEANTWVAPNKRGGIQRRCRACSAEATRRYRRASS